MNLAAAMRGEFDATFPSLRSLPKNGDRVPGRPLGDLVADGLRARGFTTSDVQCEEPFFVTRCRSGERTYPVAAYLAYLDHTGPAWVVSCRRTIGFLGRLLGKSEDIELTRVLEAIDDALKKDGRITDIRWFPDVPYDPFSQTEYALSPKTES